MRSEVIDTEPAPRLPEVGEAWMHGSDCDSVYIRIPDGVGRRTFPRYSVNVHFFSFSLFSGTIVRTERNATDIILLEPVGGVLKFQRKATA